MKTEVRPTPFKTPEKPNYTRRRIGAGGLAVAAVLTVGAVVGNAVDTMQERGRATIPTKEQVQEHPDQFVKRVVQPSDVNLDHISHEYTDKEHDYRANTDALASQLGHSSVAVGDEIMVPPTTVPEEER